MLFQYYPAWATCDFYKPFHDSNSHTTSLNIPEAQKGTPLFIYFLFSFIHPVKVKGKLGKTDHLHDKQLKNPYQVQKIHYLT